MQAGRCQFKEAPEVQVEISEAAAAVTETAPEPQPSTSCVSAGRQVTEATAPRLKEIVAE